ncbi:NAD-dependent aldehyde dehydrogenase [Akanthomyces lecanii RCEF 1005]|uniref:succinate-semialdehyde dehydrogenase [NAD(P)(+)] n=1 Tax=Akanthomyces lecanii RCEF 1005 TaxID=1081108 RepID=A0A168I5G8_CORDF|nr:NAD-dependent aldehyde dehydrogenase [Akanthomyces lecanii RCEF 1005]
MSNFASTLEYPSLFIQCNYIDGKWASSGSGTTFDVVNPADNEVIGSAPESTEEDLHVAIQAASRAFPLWRALSGRQRGRILSKVFQLLLENKQDLGKIILAENGKATGDAEGEVVFAASFFEWFAEEAARAYGSVVPHSNATFRTQVVKEPVGVCGLITPWNFPLAMGARKIAAAMAAGCTVVLKSDGLTPFSSTALALLCERAGVPKGVINVVNSLKNTPQLGLAMCESPIIKKISFTGSTRVGKLLMKQSSETLKKLSLELGGNAPFIVFDDADVEVAVASALISKFKVTGQTCVCANRIYVQDAIYDSFSKRLVEEVSKFKVGDGRDPTVTHGPLTTGTYRVEAQIRDAAAKGARILLGGRKLPKVGENFHELTILGDVPTSAVITTEETFGPVAALFRFTAEEEVINKANTSDVGLASYVMTSDLSRFYRVSERLQFGMVACNTGIISDAAAPFGGVKHSGLGREGSKYGLDDYMVLKTVVVGGINTIHSLL